jgi:ABC-2 type transport system ATP-binding protein
VDHPAVEVRDLTKRYGATTAVAGLTLSAAAGEVLAVLGPNGAGKTTTVEICEGYRRPDSGTVRVLGLDPVADARVLRPRVGVMLQGGGGYPGARAGEMLRLLASYAAHPLDPAELLDRLGLTAAAGTAYKRLSGGQKQRLSLAMAVVSRPELVFLDEPTAGLDPQARHATWDVVRQLRADGVTVVLTTHHMEEAERLADQVVVVDGGRAVAAGSPAELMSDGAGGQLRFAATPGPGPGRAGRGAAGRRHGVRAAAGRVPGQRHGRPAPAGRGDRLVRRPRGAGRGPAGAAPVAGGRLPGPHRARPAMTFTPAPEAAPLGRMLAAQTRMELRLSLRNGEQVLLTLLIPLLLTVLLALEPFLGDADEGRRIDFVVPGVLALAITSAAFTGLAIGTGFERKYGVLKRLGATALPRSVLLLGKTGAVLCIELLQVALVGGLGLALGWRPTGGAGAVVTTVLLVIAGTAAFAGLGLLLAGSLRAEATLAAANLAWFLLLFFGGVLFPLDRFPAGLASVLEFLPTAALADGLRDVLRDGAGLPVQSLLTLAVWAVLAFGAAAVTFKWE